MTIRDRYLEIPWDDLTPEEKDARQQESQWLESPDYPKNPPQIKTDSDSEPDDRRT